VVSGTFEQRYPYIARWVQTHGSIALGSDEYSRSFIRALGHRRVDLGGVGALSDGRCSAAIAGKCAGGMDADPGPRVAR
jgi:hypothetical protein